ncbi:MAG: polymer-forming cytoskeletal protein [Nitrospirota bacterium]
MFTRSKEKIESFIGINSKFKGDIDTKGTLRIDGIMEGSINADWAILGEKALLKGNIIARGIIVGGKVEGNLTAKEIVEIKPKGHVVGDISTIKLTIIEGGKFDGRSSVSKSESEVTVPQAKKV